MEHLKILLKNNNIELGKFKEITEIFEMLGNQQESKNVFKKVNKFLEEIETDYSIWQYNRDKKIELLWYKGDNEQRAAYENKQEIFSKVYKNKKPIGDYNDEGFYLMLPIVSREEVVGYFCLHKEIDLGEKWSDVYIIVQLLGFTLKYYEMVETMKEMSVIDVITGLYNSRHFRLQIDLEAEKAKRFKKPLTLAVIKIKDFSEVNKKLGFEGGEEVLKNFGTILKLESRKTDMPSRISDEVFGILLYETNLEGAQKYIKRLENYLNEEPMVINDYRFKIEMDVNLVEYSKNMSSEEFLEEGKNY
ncbi:GGDEF domain-containing protein [Bacillus sp. Brlt_9]|uniref:GGDEF domain-containing protein n=1 Tax=Bacillus sp. Brlt_9 TaxID=3110916 RepID=UPI003F7B37BB